MSGHTARFLKYWEPIADNLSKAGWSFGWVSAIDCEGRTIWIADAHRGDGKRFVVRADEKLTAFIELESAVRLDWDKDTKWVLFDPKELQRFAQRKGGFMKKRRGKVLKRLCRSSYYATAETQTEKTPSVSNKENGNL